MSRAVSAVAILAIAVGHGSPAAPDATGLERRIEEARRAIANDDSAALRVLREAVDAWGRDRPDRRDLRVLAAEIDLRLGDPAAAERELAAVLAAGDPPSAAAFRLAGVLAAAAGDFERATRLADEGLAAFPDDDDLLFWSAEAAASRGRARDRLQRFLDRTGSARDRTTLDRRLAAEQALAVHAALGDRRVWVRGAAPPAGEIPLRALGGVGGRTTGWTLSVPPTRGRRPLRLLFDTGSTGLFLTRAAARRLGAEALAETTTFGGGGDGRHASQRVLVPRLDLGGIVWNDALATVTAGAIDEERRFDGLVGLRPFDGYRVTLDLDGGSLRFSDAPSAKGGVRYWRFAGQMLVEASVGDVPGVWVFDTGAQATLISRDAADRIPGARIRDGGRVQGFGGRLPGMRLVDGADVAFLGARTGGRTLVAADLAVASRLGGVQLSGYLGVDLLDGAEFEIDTRTQRLRRVNRTGPPRGAPAGAARVSRRVARAGPDGGLPPRR